MTIGQLAKYVVSQDQMCGGLCPQASIKSRTHPSLHMRTYRPWIYCSLVEVLEEVSVSNLLPFPAVLLKNKLPGLQFLFAMSMNSLASTKTTIEQQMSIYIPFEQDQVDEKGECIMLDIWVGKVFALVLRPDELLRSDGTDTRTHCSRRRLSADS